MLNTISKIYHFKLSKFNEKEHRTVKLGNLLGFLSIVISSLYSLFYFYILDSNNAALTNEMFGLCYFLYFYFLSKGKLFQAVLSLVFVYMCHIFIVTVFFTSSQSGLHFYLILVGPTLYFFLKEDKRYYKIGFSLIAFMLFLACEALGNQFSELILSKTQLNLFYFFTISMVFCLLIIINYTFQKEIDSREKKLDESAGKLVILNSDLKKEIEERKKIEAILVEEKIKLQNAFNEVKQLSGLLPICASCKKIRDDGGYWNQIESYIRQHSEAEFSHGICPECSEKLYGKEDWYVTLKNKKSNDH